MVVGSTLALTVQVTIRLKMLVFRTYGGATHRRIDTVAPHWSQRSEVHVRHAVPRFHKVRHRAIAALACRSWKKYAANSTVFARCRWKADSYDRVLGLIVSGHTHICAIRVADRAAPIIQRYRIGADRIQTFIICIKIDISLSIIIIIIIIWFRDGNSGGSERHECKDQSSEMGYHVNDDYVL